MVTRDTNGGDADDPTDAGGPTDVDATTAGASPAPDRREEPITLAEWVTAARAWRRTRPVAGGGLLVLGGVIITLVPLQFVLNSVFVTRGASVTIGFGLGVLVVVTGVFVLVRPEFAGPLGIAGIVLATLSFPSTLGGYLVGMLLAGTGGVCSLAWDGPDESVVDDPKGDTD